jgi:hypothetical protein
MGFGVRPAKRSGEGALDRTVAAFAAKSKAVTRSSPQSKSKLLFVEDQRRVLSPASTFAVNDCRQHFAAV